MGLKDKKQTGGDNIVDGVWEKVFSKKTGKYYDNIQKLTDIEALDDNLSNLLQEKIETALADGSLTEEALKDFMKGYSYKHTDGWEYVVVDKGTTWAVTRKKPFAAGGGWKKGGGSYIHLRTSMVKMGNIEQVSQTIINQQDTDNWRITELTGGKFLMENQQAYTPAAANSTATEKKDESAEEETE